MCLSYALSSCHDPAHAVSPTQNAAAKSGTQRGLVPGRFLTAAARLAAGCATPYPLHCPAHPTLTGHMRYLVIAFLIVIVFSLGSALFYLVRDKGRSDRTVKALTLRVGLSVALFVLLMLGYRYGLIPQTRL